MTFLIDMNLSPEWTVAFQSVDLEAIHWSGVGAPDAPDSEIFQYARDNGMIVFTHDLDFSALLFHSQADSPSVIQLRSEDTRPRTMASVVIGAIRETEAQLKSGALLTVDPRRNRIHLLPIGSSKRE
ncbi:MAG: DUF5615 family PIN-like protein [Verrucomicrobiia bacterium]